MKSETRRTGPLYIASFFALALALTSSALADEASQADFDRTIAPLLAGRCLECHSGSEPEGSLDLTRRASALEGGDSGAAVTPGKLAESLLWQRVEADEMPPKHPLDDAEKELLRNWIVSGAAWGTEPIDPFRFTTDNRAGYDWWSLQPLRDVAVPEVDDKSWPRNPIDNFIAARLAENGLGHSPVADPRTLVRRLYFDLIGLPPSPERVTEFAEDPSDEAYAELVDQLLDSPRYGERWGRHWLDVVRFGESNGFERNAPRDNFWYYRDWVINALNDDMPYDAFVRRQLAGDLLNPGPDGAAAVGFLVAGVHNTVVGQSERMKKLARQDELEEIVATIGQTFLGLTVNCGRCHDHKFDPIRQSEYYRLTAAIAGVQHGERVERTVEEKLEIEQLAVDGARVAEKLARIDGEARREILTARSGDNARLLAAPQALARWEFDENFDDSIGDLHGRPAGSARIEDGALVVDGKSYVETPPLGQSIGAKTLEAWVQLDTLDQHGGAAISIETTDGIIFDAIVFAEQKPNRWLPGSNNFARTKPFSGPEDREAATRPVHVAIVYESDGTITGYRDGQPYGKPIKKSGLQSYEPGKAEIVFGLRHKPAGGNRYLRGRIFKAAFYDRALSPEEVSASAASSNEYVSEAAIVEWLPERQRLERAELKHRSAELNKQRAALETASNRKMYTMAPGQPATTRVLLRGDVMQEGEVVTPGGVASVVGVDADFGLPADANDARRRRELAEWVTSADNPLFARVIVNRVWHYHFGTGIVDTPNDLGFNGGRPSHPELLEWLASCFRADGYRLKNLHRQIVLSSTYRQASTPNPQAAQLDANNRLLWRMNPRRLEAEAIRDSMLAAAGQLNLEMGGPGFADVSVTPNNGTTYYEPIDVDGPEFFRRTVYRFAPRGGRSALLDTFDCPDPSATAPKRAVTTTPLQALSLLNNAFVLRMSDYFAQRIRQEAGDDVAQQVDRGWQLAVARSPTESERELSIRLVADHGLAALCRGLFNTSEFVVAE